MINRYEAAGSAIVWSNESEPDREHIARTFLQGERSLANIQDDFALQSELDQFLASAGVEALLISRSEAGEILLTSPQADHGLLLTGRTAEVLSGYLSGDSVSIQDRMDMTVRSSRRLE